MEELPKSPRFNVLRSRYYDCELFCSYKPHCNCSTLIIRDLNNAIVLEAIVYE